MINRKYILILFLCNYAFFTNSIFCQCPAEKFLWDRIIFLRDSSKVDPSLQIKELSRYISIVNSCTYKNDSTHALLLQRYGILCFKNHDIPNGLYFTKQSIDIIYNNWNKASINPKHVIKTFNNLRFIYESLGDNYLKERAIDSCIAVSVRLNDGYLYSLPLLSMKVKDLFDKGDYFRCISYASLIDNIPPINLTILKDELILLGIKVNALNFTNNYDEAEKTVLKGINLCKGPDLEVNFGTLYGDLAKVYENKGNKQLSLVYAQKAIQYFKKYPLKNGIASVFNNLGFILYSNKLHQYDMALIYYKRALQYADSSEALNILTNIANIYVETDQFETAHLFFDKAFNFLKPGANEQEVLHHSEKYLNDTTATEYITNLFLDKGDALLNYYKKTKKESALQSALSVYKITDSLLEIIKDQQSEAQSKLFWRSDTRRLYEHAIEVALLMNDQASAFYFFEKSKAILLNDQLRDNHWLNNDAFYKLSNLKKKKIALERNKEMDPTNKSIAPGIFDLDREIENMELTIKKSNPLYAQSFVDSSVVSLDHVRKELLVDHDAFMEIFEGDSAIYLMTITRTGSHLKEINKAKYSTLIKKYTSYLKDPALLNTDYLGFKKSAYELYQLLFQDHHLPIGRVIISPDGEYFPFESLITNSDLSAPQYFLADHAVSYTYSCQFLLNRFSSEAPATNKNFLGIAPITYPYQSSLSPLSGSEESLNNINTYFNHYENLISKDATRDKFMLDFPDYKIIQLYTHASESSNLNEPMIYFADTVLYLSDLISGKKPAARLIVLSACETGNGKFEKGEGVFSFNRGFAALGIPSCISNLWSVNNVATYQLTELFYKQLSNGVPLDIALQKAKLEYSSLNTHNQLPYYWAAMVLVGNANPIPMYHTPIWLYAVSAILTLLLLIFFWSYFKRKKDHKISL